MNFLERINRVINTESFDEVLESKDILLCEFQCDWANYKTFEQLPENYQAAILAGEKEISENR